MTELDSNEVDTRPEDNICRRYEIGSKLGQGGFGAVYNATRLEDRLKVAMKFVKKTKHTEYISIPDHPKPLPKEVALTILANKGPVMDIIRLLDWQDQQNFYVIVVQRFSHCMDVLRFVQRNGGSIDEKLAKLIMFGATLAASACCRRGVYHGDIKLENLLINLENLQIKLIDFGCGSVLTESAYTSFSGTVMYCPPEYILKGEFHGKPATVWSLGILLFRMLCGHFPDSYDFYRTNLNTWSKPGLTEDSFSIYRTNMNTWSKPGLTEAEFFSTSARPITVTLKVSSVEMFRLPGRTESSSIHFNILQGQQALVAFVPLA
ncbi:serine/threonine-protein kinase pim-2-like [Carassius gibelio]|uniref:serine/threonine-protein kinase pim-2-like n=1 Tax=Carassius gibelio TaxID=101364 RepID=UPI002279A576|nr:serine/threonine-protein kinase pim-2-like [Carassius gibelio]